MSEILVEDGTTYPANVVVPEDGDARNAASVVTGFQALADRAKYLYTKLAPWVIGGTITLAADLVFALNALNFISFTGGVFDFRTAGGVLFNGNIGGPLFDGTGGNGRANDRVCVINPGAGTTQVDPTSFNEVIVDATAACTIQVTATPAVAYVRGDRITIHNGAIYSLAIKNPGGTTVATLAVTNEYVELIHVGAGVWRLGKFKIA